MKKARRCKSANRAQVRTDLRPFVPGLDIALLEQEHAEDAKLRHDYEDEDRYQDRHELTLQTGNVNAMS